MEVSRGLSGLPRIDQACSGGPDRVAGDAANRLAGRNNQGFAQIAKPHRLIRENRLSEGLAQLCADIGLDAKPLPVVADKHPYPLDALYDAAIEAAAREAYWRDYEGFGFAGGDRKACQAEILSKITASRWAR